MRVVGLGKMANSGWIAYLVRELPSLPSRDPINQSNQQGTTTSPLILSVCSTGTAMIRTNTPPASGDLAFGSPFGMIQAAKDSAAVATAGQDAMDAYGKDTVREYVEIPAVKILNDRGEFSATMGTLPPWIRPAIRKLPWFRKGSQAVKNLAGMAIVMVAKRLSTPTDRTDLLRKLQEGKDDEGNPMGREELTAETLTQLIAGSDTTSKSVLSFFP